MSSIIIDSVTGLAIEDGAHFNEYRTLKMLYAGLSQIAFQLQQRELKFNQQNNGAFNVFSFGRDPDGSNENLDLVACTFHWFGVSVVNFARLVGFISGLENNEFERRDLGDPEKCKSIKKSVDSYVNKVPELAAVLKWRNKVGAHLAITAPRNDDKGKGAYSMVVDIDDSCHCQTAQSFE